MSSLIRCEKGHYYDSQKHHSCPFCGALNLELDIQKTMAKHSNDSSGEPAITKPMKSSSESGGGDSKTVGVYKKKLGIEPVVGWLVAVKGPDKGRDFKITSERNFIGRSDEMDISISGDEMVSRDNHAVISFNPKNSSFRIFPGDSRRLTYLNDEEVISPEILKPYDRVEIGETLLIFVPFCGESFQWDARP